MFWTSVRISWYVLRTADMISRFFLPLEHLLHRKEENNWASPNDQQVPHSSQNLFENINLQYLAMNPRPTRWSWLAKKKKEESRLTSSIRLAML
jgi:hypothetical protein